MKYFQKLFQAMLIFSAGIWAVNAAPNSTNDTASGDFTAPLPTQNETARECYNLGTKKLRAGKLDDAEMFFESSLAKQDERVQPLALFNLGHVRFDQGKEELKKSPAGANQRSRIATQDGAGAIQMAADALAGNDVQQMVEAYLAGRGVRKEMHAATEAVRQAMEAHGKTLLKWQQALDDFKSAAELNPTDTNAVRNAEIVEQAIARLVDSIRQMQEAAAGLGSKQAQLNGLLKQLRGKIPAPNAPPGAAGEEDEDDGGDHPMPESLAGMHESAADNGQEMGLKISPEEAGLLLNSIQPDGKQLPMGQGQTGQPKNRSGRIW